MYRRAVVAGALVLALIGLGESVRGGTALPTPNGSSDPALYAAVAERVRQGEGYYTAMGAELTARGYPTASVFNWRLPTLTAFQSLLSNLRVQAWLVLFVGLASAGLWLRHLRSQSVGFRLMTVACLALTLPVWPFFSAPSVLLHDLWAGQCIALSLALWANRQSYPAAAVGALAVTLREHALLFTLVMSAAGFLDRRPREGILWAAVTACGGAVLVVHALAVLRHIPADSLGSSWISLGGWSFVLATTRVNVLLMQAPGAVVALAAPAALASLLLWRTGAGKRASAVACAFTLVFLAAGRPDNWYWGLLISPLLPLGFAGLLSEPGLDDSRPRTVPQ